MLGRRARTVILLPVLVGGLLTAAGSEAVGAGPSAVFAYDRSAPLDTVKGKPVSVEGVVRQSLTFTAGASRLHADFVHPASGGPWPLVLWSPGYGEGRVVDLPAAQALARAGVASLLVDPPPGAYVGTGCDAAKDLAKYVTYVISRRRALDVIETLSNVDAKRVAAAGFSYGSTITGTLAGLEHARIAAFAFKSSRGHETGFAGALCPSLADKQAFAAYVATVGVVDPVHWLPLAGHVPVLLQNGTRDELTPRADVLALYRAAKGPKELRWYEAEHPLDAEATAYRQQWLLRQLLNK